MYMYVADPSLTRIALALPAIRRHFTRIVFPGYPEITLCITGFMSVAVTLKFPGDSVFEIVHRIGATVPHPSVVAHAS